MSHLLEVKDLTISFRGERGRNEAVSSLHFFVDEGETVCLVGESGCGKSVTALSILGLLPENGSVDEGSIQFQDQVLTDFAEKELDRIRGNEISMIFQDPLTSLNPVFTIGYQMMEGLQTHQKLTKNEAKKRAEELLLRVGLSNPEAVWKSYPHTLSGGMRQRVMIAMALSCNPKLLIADEPTTALDVTIQAQILQLIKDLQKEYPMSILLITHDMGVVANMADRIFVMYAGEIVEEVLAKELTANALHPYTRALLQAVPTTKDSKDRVLQSIPGRVPEKYDEITGCRFRERCPYADISCTGEIPMKEVQKGHWVKCIHERA